jgi:hypothetical protein
MIETNIRILTPGPNFYLNTRRASVVAPDLSADLLERACSSLRHRYRLPAVPTHASGEIVVATQDLLPNLVDHGEDWRFEVRDKGEALRLCFSEPDDRPLLVRLVERSLMIEIQHRTNLWAFPDEPHLWYKPEPFQVSGDFAAYSRVEVSAISVESVGMGVVVDIGTGFFTISTLADFFRQDLPLAEQRRFQERFAYLSQRQKQRKGTLLYDLGGSKRKKCYFVEFLTGVTCGTTGSFTIDGQDYPSLHVYYERRHPHLGVGPGDPVAKVSFSHMGRPVPVAGKRLHLRVMNEVLPENLKQVDKIEPAERARLVDEFWARLEEHPLGLGKPGVEKKLWQPGAGRAVQLQQPQLMFPGRTLQPPQNGDLRTRKEYFTRRLRLLRESGCLQIPPAVERVVHLAIPAKADEEMAERLAEDMSEYLSIWTKLNISAEPLVYADTEEAIARLSQKRPGVVVFVFDDNDPATYFQVTHELKEWRVKHVTYRMLKSKFDRLKAVQDQSRSTDDRPPRGLREWQSFTEMTALDVLQQMECVPWLVAGEFQYEARLVIDVGEDRRHFALTLLICRAQTRQPSFWLDTVTEIKSDAKFETINSKQLYDKIMALFKRMPRRQFTALASLLVERDGHECGDELKAIDDAKSELIRQGFLEASAQMDVVDFHKRSVKNIRIWDRDENGPVRHAPDGTLVIIDRRTAVLTNTGAATLHQGTAEPIMLVAPRGNVDLVAAATCMHATTHLNWSSPSVAQRLPLELKRTDEDLEKKAAQEIRLYK